LSGSENRAGVLDTGSLGTAESSMAKVSVSEALMRVADRCVQVMGGTGVSTETIVEQAFREIRAFRIYDGPTEVHKWSLAKKIKRDWKAGRRTANPAQGDFAAGITPPRATVNSAATSRTVWPNIGNRSSVRRLVMPETEIAAKGSAQSL
jgi:acyl-CoA dehydrogenase-like protein